MIALFFAVMIHELTHAFVPRMYCYDIKRVGVFFLGPIPAGAFVESSGNVERKTRSREALELAGAGIYTDLIITGVAFDDYV